MGRLTDADIRAWIRKAEPIAGKSDGGGLTFTLTAKGRASWVFRFRHGGKQRELTLGTYPDITLKRARELATSARAKVQQGIDVARAKQEELIARSTAGTVKELCEDYYSRTIAGRITRPDIVRQRLDNDLIPKLGRMRIADVKPMDVDRMIKAILDRGSPVMANRVLATTKSVFDYAIRRHWVEQNPAAAFRRADAGGEEQERQRSLSKAELTTLFQSIRDVGPHFRIYDLIVKLLLVTAVRVSELIEAPWSEFDLDADIPVWLLPAHRVKKGPKIWKRDLLIPLPPAAVEWLAEIRRTSIASDFVFPARRRSKRPTMATGTVNWALGELEHGLEHFTVHDLRRTARTHLGKLRTAPHVAERCLNHKLPGVNDTYDTHDYFDERRVALATWADCLLLLDKGPLQNVVLIDECRQA